MMTETISPPDSQAVESPHLARPETVLAILDNFTGKDMPGRQREIQDCVDKILAKVDPKPATS
jgi:hypothetical protein